MILSNILLLFLLLISTSSSQHILRLPIHQGMPKDLESLKNIWSTLANYYYNFENISSNSSAKSTDSPWAVRSHFLSGLKKHIRQQQSQQQHDSTKQAITETTNDNYANSSPSSLVNNFKHKHTNNVTSSIILRKTITHHQHNQSTSSSISENNFQEFYNPQIESTAPEPLNNPEPVSTPPLKPVQNTSNQTDFSLYSVFGNAYLVEAFAGSQQSSFNLMLDTGSSYTWLTQQNCTSCQEIGIKKSFDCEQSTTCANQKKEVNLVYGRGRVNATIIKDSLGLDHKLLTVQNQDMLLASSISDLRFFPGHGLMGLGFEELSDGRVTFVSNLKNQGKIDKRVFAISLQGNSEEIEFGQTNKDFFIIGGDGIDEQLIEKADSFTCPVSYSPYWSVDVSSIVPIISDVEMDIKLGSQVAVIDTGTSFIVFDSEDFDILSKFFLNKLKKLDCIFDITYNLIKCQSLDKSVYPIFKFSLCNHSRPILVYPEQYLVCDTACYVRIAGISFGFSLKRMVILGDIFIRQQYILFNQDDLTITFFNKKKQITEP